MVINCTGDLLSSKADIIAHQVNCMGVMGAGLAKQIRARYPEVYSEYQRFCQGALATGDGSQLLGVVQVVRTENGPLFANCFAQHKYGRTGRHTDYNALETCLKGIRDVNPGSKVAIPYQMGCGLAGGDWAVVSEIIGRVFNDTEDICEIWRLE